MKISASAKEKIANKATPQVYADLCKSTLAQVILFNRRRGGEVGKMLLQRFLDRNTNPVHTDVTVGLTKFEKQLCKHFSRVEIEGKRGRKVPMLLSPDVVSALELLISKRTQCKVPSSNKYMFARPLVDSYYRGNDCMRLHAQQCGADKPGLLQSTKLRKHISTMSQVMNLKEHELDQVADFLGHDIYPCTQRVL